MNRDLQVVTALGGTALAGFGLLPFVHVATAPDAWFDVQWPRDLDGQQALALLRHLAAVRRPDVIAFEALGHRARIVHRVGVAQHDTQRLQHALSTFLPDALLTESIRPADRTFTSAVEVRLSTRERSLRTDAVEDVSRSVLSALADHRSGEAVLQVIIGPRLAPLHVSSESTGLPTASEALRRTVSGNPHTFDARSRTQLQAKVGDHGVRAVLRVTVSHKDPKLARGALQRVIGALRVAEAPGSHLRVRRTSAERVAGAIPPWRWPTALNVNELLSLLAWPIGDGDYPGVVRIASRRLAVPRAVRSVGRVIGEGNHPATLRPVALGTAGSLLHTHVLGPTGTGKSTLLANLVLQDIAAGRGVVVIEPKGDLVADLLERIPPEREADVVLLDPTDEAPIGLNPLANGSPELVSDQVLAVFRGLFGDYLGPRTTDVLHASLLTLARSQSATLVALPLLLTDDRFRRDLTTPVLDDLALGPFWAWYEALSDAERHQVISPVMNKVRPFLLRERVRHVLGQVQPSFDITSVFTERKIVLVPLSKGTLGSESAGLLGSLVVSQLWQAAQARSRIPPNGRHPVSVVIDEWQDFLHLPTDLADVLAQARGLGLGLTLAHQHLGQLSPNLRAAVLANARSRVCFRLSGEDAATLAKSTELLDARDFQSLGAYETYASLVADGAVQPYCSATTRPLPETTGNARRVRERSRAQYGRRRETIETELQQLWNRDAHTAKKPTVGSRKRRNTNREAEGGSP